MKATGDLLEYVIVGRKNPTPGFPQPPLFKMTIFAPNVVVAKSRFWYFLSQLHKAKKMAGEIVSIKEINQKGRATIQNFAIWLRYDSRSGTHNMYREYRDTSRASAVTQCYRDMAARHMTRTHAIQIIRVDTIEAAKTRRAHMKQFFESKIKFPLPSRKLPGSNKTFVANRPKTTY
eukprot:m.21954 g.21954  ORF g.21954 m.21954 type:complete len:176 (-) comp33321_c0_seq1:130-657(-)